MMTSTSCPLVKSQRNTTSRIWKFDGRTVATALAFGAGLAFGMSLLSVSMRFIQS